LGAEAVEDVHHALHLVRLAPYGQLLTRVVEHWALATTRLRALPAARLRMQPMSTQAKYWYPTPGIEHLQLGKSWHLSRCTSLKSACAFAGALMPVSAELTAMQLDRTASALHCCITIVPACLSIDRLEGHEVKHGEASA
jgi:hypothetical protein